MVRRAARRGRRVEAHKQLGTSVHVNLLRPAHNNIDQDKDKNHNLPLGYSGILGVPMAERSKTLDFGSGLEIAQVQILYVTEALFISTIDLVLYRHSPLFCLIRSSHRNESLSRSVESQASEKASGCLTLKYDSSVGPRVFTVYTDTSSLFTSTIRRSPPASVH
ncbi:hypothetical protein J6590_008831 [Homalodisca vitripennis]|nr:hypothetical protein J6590_008831 [Homalodisca vitripennis]